MKQLGQRLMARELDCQIAEFQVRIAVMNGYIAIGIPIRDGRGMNPSGKRGSPLSNVFEQHSQLEHRALPTPYSV